MGIMPTQLKLFDDFQTAKTCPACGAVLPLTNEFWYFKKSGRQKGQPQPRCKACMKEHKRKQIESGYGARDCRRRYYVDPEKACRLTREWQKRNREKYNEYQRNYSRANKPIVSARMRLKSRFDSLKLRTRHSAKQPSIGFAKLLLGLQGGLCAYCKRDVPDGYHIDHILALARGGTNDILNLVISCPSCNHSKGKKLVDKWLAKRGMMSKHGTSG